LAPTSVHRNTLRETSSDNKLKKNVKNTLFLPYCRREVLALGVQGFPARLPPALRDFAAGCIWISFAPKGSKTRGFESISKMSFLRGPSRGPYWPRRRSAETPNGKLPQETSSKNVKNTLFLPYCRREVLVLGVQGFPARLAPALRDFAAGCI